MKIAVLKEPDPEEGRVAITPETAKRFIGLGATVLVEAGAGLRSLILDFDYSMVGAVVAETAADAVREADVVLTVRRPSQEVLAQLKKGALAIAMMTVVHSNYLTGLEQKLLQTQFSNFAFQYPYEFVAAPAGKERIPTQDGAQGLCQIA